MGPQAFVMGAGCFPDVTGASNPPCRAGCPPAARCVQRRVSASPSTFTQCATHPPEGGTDPLDMSAAAENGSPV